MPFTSALPGRLNATSRAGLGHRPRGQRSTGRRRQPLPRPWAPSRSRPRPPPPRSFGRRPAPRPRAAASRRRLGREGAARARPWPRPRDGRRPRPRAPRAALLAPGLLCPSERLQLPGAHCSHSAQRPRQLQHSTLCLNVLRPYLRGLTALGVPQHPPGAATKRPHPSLCHCIPPACGVHWCHEKSRLHRPAHPSYIFQAAASTLAPFCLLSLHYLSSKATEK